MWGITSVLWRDNISTVRDNFRTEGGVQYMWGDNISTRGGITSVHVGDNISTVEGIQYSGRRILI